MKERRSQPTAIEARVSTLARHRHRAREHGRRFAHEATHMTSLSTTLYPHSRLDFIFFMCPYCSIARLASRRSESKIDLAMPMSRRFLNTLCRPRATRTPLSQWWGSRSRMFGSRPAAS